MAIATLKNGSREPSGLVALIMLTLSKLHLENRFLFDELVSKCKKESYFLDQDTKEKLFLLGLAGRNGEITPATKNVVLSLLTNNDDELDLSIEAPFMHRLD